MVVVVGVSRTTVPWVIGLIRTILSGWADEGGRWSERPSMKGRKRERSWWWSNRRRGGPPSSEASVAVDEAMVR